MEIESNIRSDRYDSLMVSDNMEQLKKIRSLLRRKSTDQREFETKFFTVKTKKIELIQKFIQPGSTVDSTYIHIFKDKTSLEKLKIEKNNREYQRLMLSSVAHEFRNPLNSVSLNLELIQALAKENTQIKGPIDNAKKSCMMINSYVEDILDLSRIERGAFKLNPSIYKIQDVFDEVEDLFKSEATMKGLEMTFSISETVKKSEINGDQGRMRQVLINIVSNALKFTNTIVTVEWFDMIHFRLGADNQLLYWPPNQNEGSRDQQEEIENRYNLKSLDLATKLIQSKGLDPHKYIFMTVTDDGMGIWDEDQPKLFKLFGKIEKTHHKNNKGWGLGLTICKKIINKMNGDIDFISSPSGSVFGYWFSVDEDYILFPEIKPEEIWENSEHTELKSISIHKNYLKEI